MYVLCTAYYRVLPIQSSSIDVIYTSTQHLDGNKSTKSEHGDNTKVAVLGSAVDNNLRSLSRGRRSAVRLLASGVLGDDGSGSTTLVAGRAGLLSLGDGLLLVAVFLLAVVLVAGLAVLVVIVLGLVLLLTVVLLARVSGLRLNWADGGANSDGLGDGGRSLRAVGNLRRAVSDGLDLSGVDGRGGHLLGGGDRAHGGGNGNSLSDDDRTLRALGNLRRALGDSSDLGGVDSGGGPLLGLGLDLSLGLSHDSTGGGRSLSDISASGGGSLSDIGRGRALSGGDIISASGGGSSGRRSASTRRLAGKGRGGSSQVARGGVRAVGLSSRENGF